MRTLYDVASTRLSLTAPDGGGETAFRYDPFRRPVGTSILRLQHANASAATRLRSSRVLGSAGGTLHSLGAGKMKAHDGTLSVYFVVYEVRES